VWRARIVLATAEGCGTPKITPRRRLQTVSVALAAPLYGGGRRRFAARQDAQARQSAGPRAGRGVGLYVDPPTHSLVLAVDEKSHIQALDRTQPGLPTKRGRAGTTTHDYIRHGTTTLFAALNVLDGAVIGQCMQRHQHREFLRFLGRLERDIPAGRLIHVFLDNDGSHKHP